MLDGQNCDYYAVPGPPRRPIYTGRLKVVDQNQTILQIAYNCYWYYLQGTLFLKSRETDNLVNSWYDPNQLLRVILWPEDTRTCETWE